MAQPNLFVNQWNKSAENSNIGMGTLVGIETYSRKGVAQLTKDLTPVNASPTFFTGLQKYIASDGNLTVISINTASTFLDIQYSTDGGTTWNDGAAISSAGAFGLAYYQGYFIFFTATHVYYLSSSTPSSSPTQWSTFALNSGEHPSILFPADNNVYFGNGQTVGMFGAVPGTTFNPAGTINVDYQFYANRSGAIGGNTSLNLLPSTYQINCISFLLPVYIALGTGGAGSSSPTSQIADLVLWNPANTTAEAPLRMFSKSSSNGAPIGAANNGIAQLINRNNTLYAVTSGNMAVYETNGTNFSLITDLSLRSSIRKTTGMENTTAVYMTGFPSAIAVVGNKILIGISTPNSPSYPTGYGLFPCGIWTIAFSDGGGIGEISYGINGNSVQCEYTISSNTTVATSNLYQIGCIFPTTGGSALVSWNDGNVNAVGMDYINFGTTTSYYESNISCVIIESEMMEVGTPLQPVTIGSLQANLVRDLMTGQTFSVYYRTSYDQDFALVTGPAFTGTWTGGNIQGGLSINGHFIPPTRYIQFQLHMATVPSSTNTTIAAYTPQLRDFIVGNPNVK